MAGPTAGFVKLAATPYSLRYQVYASDGALKAIPLIASGSAQSLYYDAAVGPLKTYLGQLVSSGASWGADTVYPEDVSAGPLQNGKLRIKLTPCTSPATDLASSASLQLYNSGAGTAATNFLAVKGGEVGVGTLSPTQTFTLAIVDIEFAHSAVR